MLWKILLSLRKKKIKNEIDELLDVRNMSSISAVPIGTVDQHFLNTVAP